MGSPSRNVQYHPPRLSEDRLNLPQPHSPSLPTHCSGKSGMRPALGSTLRPRPPGLSSSVDDSCPFGATSRAREAGSAACFTVLECLARVLRPSEGDARAHGSGKHGRGGPPMSRCQDHQLQQRATGVQRHCREHNERDSHTGSRRDPSVERRRTRSHAPSGSSGGRDETRRARRWGAELYPLQRFQRCRPARRRWPPA